MFMVSGQSLQFEGLEDFFKNLINGLEIYVLQKKNNEGVIKIKKNFRRISWNIYVNPTTQIADIMLIVYLKDKKNQIVSVMLMV